jgi:hypothetical protein
MYVTTRYVGNVAGWIKGWMDGRTATTSTTMTMMQMSLMIDSTA